MGGQDYYPGMARVREAATYHKIALTQHPLPRYIDDTVKRDRRLFGRCTTGVLPSIPVQTYSIPSTSLSLPGSSLCIPTNSASTPTRSFSPVLSEDTLSVSGLSNIAAATPSEGPGGAVISGFPQVPTHTPSPSLWD